MGELTQLFAAIRTGSDAALGRLYELLYADLRRIAHARLHHASGLTLQTTGLVNESFLRLVKVGEVDVADRAHFLAYAARAMRSVVVDLVREGAAERRGAGVEQVTLSTTIAESVTPDTRLVVRIHETLDELGAIDPRLAQVVELRFFGGLDAAEAAEALGVSLRTVERLWEKARTYLFAALK